MDSVQYGIYKIELDRDFFGRRNGIRNIFFDDGADVGCDIGVKMYRIWKIGVGDGEVGFLIFEDLGSKKVG